MAVTTTTVANNPYNKKRMHAAHSSTPTPSSRSGQHVATTNFVQHKNTLIIQRIIPHTPAYTLQATPHRTRWQQCNLKPQPNSTTETTPCCCQYACLMMLKQRKQRSYHSCTLFIEWLAPPATWPSPSPQNPPCFQPDLGSVHSTTQLRAQTACPSDKPL